MPRVVCQVRVRPDRVTLVWSDGQAAFEPYHLTGPEVTELHQLASRAREALHRLANLGQHPAEHDTARAGQELAQAGHQLYRHLFRLDRAPADSAEVRDWLADLENRGAVDSVEFLGAPGLLPWNFLCAIAPDESVFHGADAPGWRVFWGVCHNLITGRRVNALRQADWLEQPPVLLVIDPELRAALPEPQQKRLREFVEVNHLPTAETLDQLIAALRTQAPEVLYFFCRASGDGLLLGGAELAAGDLEEALGEQGDGPPWNSRIVFVNACQGSGAASWAQTAERLVGLGLGGLILPEEPLPEGPASAFGLDFLAGFLYGRQPAGKLLQSLRGQTAPLGLLYGSTCPPGLRVTWQEGEVPEEAEKPEPLPPLPDTPYRPFTPYDGEDRALFVGRDDDSAAVADLLDAAATRLVVVHGRSGVGKSSLLRAGVIPYLEADNVGYRALRDRSEPEEGEEEDDSPVLAVRTTFDLPGQLAYALAAYCNRPYRYTTPAGRTVTVDLPGILQRLMPQREDVAGDPEAQARVTATPSLAPRAPGAESTAGRPEGDDDEDLREALCDDPALLARLLGALGERLPFELVLLIEQGEEMFTLARAREDADNRRLSLEMFHRLAGSPGPGKVLLALRTEYYGRLITNLRQHLRRAESVRDYFLAELDENAMVAAVEQPTLNEPVPYSDEVPFEKYRFTYEEGLAETIVREARRSARERRESALALIQAICTRLAALVEVRPERTVTAADLKAIGGVEGGLVRYVEELIGQAGLAGSDRKRLRALITQLYERQPDGTLTRALVPVQQLVKEWKNPAQVETVIQAGEAENVGLLETVWLQTKEGENAFVSLSHDSLVPVAAHWDEFGKSHGQSWTRTVDLLWIFIPLLILVLVFFYSFYVRPYYRTVKEFEDFQKDQLVKAEEQKLRQRGVEAERWPLYVGQVALAAEAWKQGDTLRARQLLLTQRNSPIGDLRSFEWYYLWQLAHADRQTLLGHEGPVTSVALSADGKRLASASQDGSVRLWDVARGVELVSVKADPGSVNAVALSADGKLLASGGSDKMVKILEVSEDGQPKDLKAVLSGHEGPVLAVAFSKDGTLASGSADGTVRLWDVSQGKERKTLKEHGGPVQAVAFAPDGKLLASGGADQAVIVWDAAGSVTHKLGNHGGPVYAVAFSPDGKLLASGGEQKDGPLASGVVRLWDPATGKDKGSARQPAAVLAVAFAADGKTCAAGGKDWTVRLRDVASMKELTVLRGHLGWASAVAFTGDGQTLVTAGYDSTIKLWPASGPAPDLLQAHEGDVSAVAVAPDDKLAASGGADGTVKLWEIATGKEVRTLKGPGGPVLALAFAKQKGKLLLAGAVWSEDKDGGRVVVWDADKGGVVHTLKANGQPVAGVAFAPDGKLLAVAGGDGMLLLFDADKGTLRTTLKGQTGVVRCVAFSPDGKQLASGGADAKVRVWKLGSEGTQGVPLTLEGHTGEVTTLAFAPDSKELVSASLDHTLRRWDVPTGKLIVVMRGHTAEVLSAAYSPKGETIVSGGRDGTVRLWDVLRGEQRFVLTNQSEPVRGVAFSSDRRTLVSAGPGGTVRLWRAAQEEKPPAIHEQGPAPEEPPPEPEGEGQ